MRLKTLTGLGLATLCATIGVAVAPGAAQAAAPKLRLMPVGDSITWGVGSSNGSGYRGPLWNDLVAHGYGTGLDFVGSQYGGSMPDPDNEGHSGWRIEQIAGIITPLLQQYRPNVVTLHLGTNDMNQNYQVATAPDRLGSLIDQILAAAPDASVEVATLVPAMDPTVQSRVTQFNAQIPGLVQARRNAGKHVRLVSMSAVTSADLADGLHPNDTGYQKMADAWDAAIRQSIADGWIQDPVGVPGCTTVGAWADRGQVAGGVGSTLAHVQFADVNGDRKDDYLVVADNGAVTEWQNNGGDGAGGWTGKGQIATGAGANLAHIRFADINADGRDDFLVVADNGAVTEWQNNGGDGSGGWIGMGQIATGVGSDLTHLRFADVNGDGRDDYLVVADNGAVRAWLNNGGDGAGGWSDRGQIAAGVGSDLTHLRFADINGDGRDDYLIVSDTSAVHEWQNNC
jgi:lysophospholipase L1-like esterase